MSQDIGAKVERFHAEEGYDFKAIRDSHQDVSQENWVIKYSGQSHRIYAAYTSEETSKLITGLHTQFRQNNGNRTDDSYRARLERLILIGRDENFQGDEGRVLQLVQKKGEYQLVYYKVKRGKVLSAGNPAKIGDSTKLTHIKKPYTKQSEAESKAQKASDSLDFEVDEPALPAVQKPDDEYRLKDLSKDEEGLGGRPQDDATRNRFKIDLMSKQEI